MQRTKNLEHLEFINAYYITSLPKILRAAPKLRYLKLTSFTGFEIPRSNFQETGKALTEMKDLEFVDFSYGAMKIFPELLSLPKLRTIVYLYPATFPKPPEALSGIDSTRIRIITQKSPRRHWQPYENVIEAQRNRRMASAKVQYWLSTRKGSKPTRVSAKSASTNPSSEK